MRQALRTARFFAGLYASTAVRHYAGRVRGDLPARLALREGRLDPYPIYEQIRAQGPFVVNRFGSLVTADHGICAEILRSRRFGSAPEDQAYDRSKPGDGMSILDLNPPDHTRLRRLVAPAFGPRAIDAFDEQVRERSAELIGAMEGEVDLVSALAAPLPIAVISSLLGIPGDHEQEFLRYGHAIAGAIGGVRGVRHATELARAGRALDELFTSIIDRRRSEPSDDVLGVLARSDDLDPAEITPLCILLLVAGFETTVNAIANAVLALDRHPAQWERLVADPSLAPAAADEVLRYDPPVQRTYRCSFDDTEIAGQPIAAGQWVQVLLGGANRDPAVFEHPERFDVGRANATAALTFSGGIHFCLGAPLARLEVAIALEELANRLPRLRVTGAPTYRPTTVIRGPARLPVAVG